MWVLYPVAGIISLGIILPVGYYTHVGYTTQTMLGIIPSDEFASGYLLIELPDNHLIIELPVNRVTC